MKAKSIVQVQCNILTCFPAATDSFICISSPQLQLSTHSVGICSVYSYHIRSCVFFLWFCSDFVTCQYTLWLASHDHTVSPKLPVVPLIWNWVTLEHDCEPSEVQQNCGDSMYCNVDVKMQSYHNCVKLSQWHVHVN